MIVKIMLWFGIFINLFDERSGVLYNLLGDDNIYGGKFERIRTVGIFLKTLLFLVLFSLFTNEES